MIPLGTPTASVSNEVAEVQRLLKKTGVKYSMHSAGTTLGMFGLSPSSFSLFAFPSTCCGPVVCKAHLFSEGSWEEVMRIIGQCHSMLHARGVVRIQSDIRVGSRTDKKQGFEDKVAAVEKLLKNDDKTAEQNGENAEPQT